MNIYVGNLPFSITEEQLQSLFEEFGEVSSARVIKDKFTGKSKGFGFVEMADNNAAQAAIEALNGKEYEGRGLSVNEARQREEQPRQQRYGNSSSSYRPQQRRGNNNRY